MTVGVIIPARDEEKSIGLVVEGLLALHNEQQTRLIDDIVVCESKSHSTRLANN
jgi:hypothetical protein